MRTNEEIIEIIKRRSEEKKLSMSELARRVGTAKSAMSRYFNLTREFPINRVNDFASVLDLTPEYILGFEAENDINYIYDQLSRDRKNRVYSYAEYQLHEQNSYIATTAAGTPIEGEQVPIVYGDQHDISLLVSGDSMESLYKDGDIITYRKQPTLENGEIGVFVLNGGVTMKRFKNNGDIRLQSLNSKYQDIIVTDADDFAILGKVIS